MISRSSVIVHFFFFNDTATTEIYTLSLHDALPSSDRVVHTALGRGGCGLLAGRHHGGLAHLAAARSEEHTSELQSQSKIVCRLLLEKKKMMSSAISSRPTAPNVTVYTSVPSRPSAA